MLFPPSEDLPSDVLAAVDLGSNSFHMIVARTAGGHVQVIDRLKEMVRLGEGLTPEKTLRPEVEARALACLERFGQRLRNLPPGSVRAVGTNTLRQIRPDCEFLARAEAALGHPIEVISGREEARLIYLGVANGLAPDGGRRLVVDIGGGSTELIVGEGFQAKLRESLHMGCVSMSLRYFPKGKVTAKAMEKAELAGAMEIRPVRERFRKSGWRSAVGSSGTIKSIATVLSNAGWCKDGISAEALAKLRQVLIDAGSLAEVQLKGLAEERRPVFAGGLAVLRAVFLNLGIERMLVSDEALREGLLYEKIGVLQQQDVQKRTVASLVQRFSIDEEHAARVRDTALILYGQVVQPWNLTDRNHPVLLTWAAQLHEIGLAVSHSQYQKHGAYLLRHADLSGFSRQEQAVLAVLVLGHRRKFPSDEFQQLSPAAQVWAKRLCIILRLAVLLHRGRSPAAKPFPMLQVQGDHLHLRFPEYWLAERPLTQLELEEEAKRLAPVGIRLTFGAAAGF